VAKWDCLVHHENASAHAALSVMIHGQEQNGSLPLFPRPCSLWHLLHFRDGIEAQKKEALIMFWRYSKICSMCLMVFMICFSMLAEFFSVLLDLLTFCTLW
jgi:hypothetical protein